MPNVEMNSPENVKMSLKEAIGILAAKKLDDVARNAERSAGACQLGIEALKFTIQFRSIYPLPLLPGETKGE